ncbi:MAG: YitT family protein [Bacteroidales bacterium]|jgi:uncharacterized membrane-anchored protein YitT (DUF2179 family)|nr:YitT family protein [Bacteroidota bacterium]NLO00416.1 YitT family protein [Bacteroidales bacterium]
MPDQKKNSLPRLFKEYLILSIGILIYTSGWTIFLTPNNLVGGGVSGIGAIIQYATGVKMGYTYFAINAILLIVAFFILGSSFGAKTIYGIILASFLLNFLQVIIPQTVIQDFALSNGKLMSSLIGGAMAGVGIGMSISQGGSTGGTDIIALIVSKYRNVSPGRMILLMDVIIIASSVLVPSFTADGAAIPFVAKVITAVYGMIIVSVDSYVIDLYLAGSKQSVQLFILSRHFSEIADMIAQDFRRGVTVLNGKGWYTKQETEVLMVILPKTDLNVLLRRVKQIDSEVFLSISSVSGVYGKGFDTIKKH